MRGGGNAAGWRAAMGGLALAALLLPPVRAATESSMTMHMLVQFPLLLLGGGLLAGALPPAGRRWVDRWNQLGMAGLLAAALALALAMVPRLLDLALVDARVEAVKFIVGILAGAALWLSWRAAGPIVQAFFLGNVLPMMAAVGLLYQESTSRVCNAYRLDDQQSLGFALVWLALAVLLAWLASLAAGRAGEQTPGLTAP